jgi:hypothetical protein
MANDVQIKIRTLYDDKGATAAIRDMDRLENATTKANSTSAKFTGSLSKMATGAGAVAGSLVAVGAGLQQVFELAQQGEAIQRTAATFDALSESIGSTSDSLLNEMRAATNGAVSDLVLMENANRLVSMGLANTSEEAAKLANIATTLGQAMGRDAQTSMEEFSQLLANQSIELLDSFGISSGRVRDEVNRMTTEIDGMNRETAFTIAVMNEADASMARLAGSMDDTSTSASQLSAEMDNLLNQGKSWFADFTQPLTEGTLAVVGGLNRVIDASEKAEDRLAKYNAEGTRGSLVQRNQSLNLALAADSWQDYNLAVSQSEEVNLRFTRSAYEAIKAAQGQERRVEQLARASEELTEQQERMAVMQVRLADVARDEAQSRLTNNSEMRAEQAERRAVVAEMEAQLRAEQELFQEQRENHRVWMQGFEEQRSARIELARGIAEVGQVQREAFGQETINQLSTLEDEAQNYAMVMFEAAAASGATATELVALGTQAGLTAEQLETLVERAALTQFAEELGTAVTSGTMSIVEATQAFEEFQNTLQNTEGAVQSAQAIDAISGNARNAETSIRNVSLALDELNGKTVTATINVNTPTIDVTGGTGQAGQGQAFNQGGYTGAGGVNQVAGVVHRGEYVVPQWMVNENPALVKALENMRSGNTTNNMTLNVTTSAGAVAVTSGFEYMSAMVN